MSALGEFPVSVERTHRLAIEQANAWRGRCVNLFARGEHIVGCALLAAEGSRPLPMLLSQRITRLTGLIVGDLKKSQALADFDSFTADRNDIVHGRGKVHIDGEGEWFLTLETVDRAGFAVRNIDRAEAEIFTKRLKVSVDRLATALTA